LYLKSNTLFTGKVCIRIEDIDSTQTYLMERCANTKPIEGTAILSYNQHSGIGQRGNKWHTDPNEAIAVSVVFYPHSLAIGDQFYLNMAIALSVRSLFAELSSQEVKIKWPNDIMVDSKKIAGVLLNNVLKGNGIEQTIVGIGLNVNQSRFPDHLPQATSLNLVTGKVFELDAVTVALFEKLEFEYLRLRSGRFSEILSDFNLHLFRKDERVTVSSASGARSDVFIVGVNSGGDLIVRDLQGSNQQYRHGQVFLNYE